MVCVGEDLSKGVVFDAEAEANVCDLDDGGYGAWLCHRQLGSSDHQLRHNTKTIDHRSLKHLPHGEHSKKRRREKKDIFSKGRNVDLEE